MKGMIAMFMASLLFVSLSHLVEAAPKSGEWTYGTCVAGCDDSYRYCQRHQSSEINCDRQLRACYEFCNEEFDRGDNVTSGGALQGKPVRPAPRAEKRPRARVEIGTVKFVHKGGGRVLGPLVVGQRVNIHVTVENAGPPDSVTSEFRVYLWQDGTLIRKDGYPHVGEGGIRGKGLRGGRATFATFEDVTMPDRPGRYCWTVSLKQTPNGRMMLGDPKRLCALVGGGLKPNLRVR